MKMRYWIVFLSLLLTGSRAVAFELSGRLAHGEVVVATGANFGVSGGLEHLVYDDFQRDNISLDATVGRWRTTNDLSIVAVGRHPRVSRAAYRDFIGADNATVGTVNSVLSRKWFAQYWFRLEAWDWGTGSYGSGDQHLSNLKYFRLWNPGSVIENVYAGFRFSIDSSSAFVVENVPQQNNVFVYDQDVSKGGVDDGNWHLLQFEFADSTQPGAADASMKIWFDGKLVASEDGFVGRSTDQLKRIYQLGFVSAWPPAEGESSSVPNRFFMHDAYAAPSWARVEIGDLQDYDSCTRRELQLPLVWGPGEVQFRVNQGAFHDGDEVFLFVINNLGDVVAVSPVTIGEERSPPLPPRDISID